MKFHLIDTSVIFIDSTHVKACANSKKMRNRVAHQEALWFEEELKKKNKNAAPQTLTVDNLRKETIERIFGTAKEYHDFVYEQSPVLKPEAKAIWGHTCIAGGLLHRNSRKNALHLQIVIRTFEIENAIVQMLFKLYSEYKNAHMCNCILLFFVI